MGASQTPIHKPPYSHMASNSCLKASIPPAADLIGIM